MSNSVNQLNQRISNLYALVGQSGGGSQDLSQVLTIGNDAGGLDIDNVGTLTTGTLNYTTLNPPIFVTTPSLSEVLTEGNTATNSISLNNTDIAIPTQNNVISLLPNFSANNPHITLTDGAITNTIDKNGYTTRNSVQNATHYLNFSDSSATGTGAIQKTAGIQCNPSLGSVNLEGSGGTGVITLSPDLTANNPTIVLTDGTTSNTITKTGISGTAANATTATNIAGGLGGSIPYQSAVNTTALLANGTAGQVLTSAGTTLPPVWSSAGGSQNLTQVLTTGNNGGALNMTNLGSVTATSFVGTASSATNVITTQDDTAGTYLIPFQKTIGNNPLFVDNNLGPLTYNPSAATLNTGSLVCDATTGSVSVTNGTQASGTLTGSSFTTTGGGYTYHVIKTTSSIVISGSLSNVEIISIGGGGGGGVVSTEIGGAGGGGAGALVYSGVIPFLTTQTTTATIGAGGIAGVATTGVGGTGGTTTFGGLYSALGGGGGGGFSTTTGAAVAPTASSIGNGGGGSGAGTGGGSGTTTGAVGGSGSFNGGNGFIFGGGGGGGGAGAVGGTTTSSSAAAGGSGSNTYSSWLSVIGAYNSIGALDAATKTAISGGFIAGGGGSGSRLTTAPVGAGGAGGGGTGGWFNNGGSPTEGVVNTGGGGGGGGTSSTNGRAGGTGLMIIRFPTAGATPITSTLTATGLTFNYNVGFVNLVANLPTSNAGLPSGTIYRDGASANAFLKIV